MQYTPREKLYREAMELSPETKGNSARSLGDYHHFNNVMLATARLIDYFRHIAHVEGLFFAEAIDRELLAHLCYPARGELGNNPEYKRPFLLMLAAYYHDLGKTIVYPRHAIEGSIILDNHTTDTLRALNQIAGRYGFTSFSREDLFFVSHLVYYHDQFGTLGTGEAGYLRLADLIQRLKTCCMNQPDGSHGRKHMICSAKNLFDLWVLNLADIMVSIGDMCGGQPQKKNESQKKCLGSSVYTLQRIESFLSKMEERKHDLCIAIDLLDKFTKKRHTDDITVLEEDCAACARRHTVERIRRLLRALLIDNRPSYVSEFGGYPAVEKMLHKVDELKLRDWHAIISRVIKSVSEPSEFARRFAWVGQMDYSFSFFDKISKRAMEVIKDKIDNPDLENGAGRGWCYEGKRDGGNARKRAKRRKQDKKAEKQFLLATNAEIFVENLAAVIVQIIHHLLFREKEFGRLINFEFTDARDRLTEDKIDRIIALQGPNREKRSVQLSLEGIFFFK